MKKFHEKPSEKKQKAKRHGKCQKWYRKLKNKHQCNKHDYCVKFIPGNGSIDV